jgi:hypothetical protein
MPINRDILDDARPTSIQKSCTFLDDVFDLDRKHAFTPARASKALAHG